MRKPFRITYTIVIPASKANLLIQMTSQHELFIFTRIETLLTQLQILNI